MNATATSLHWVAIGPLSAIPRLGARCVIKGETSIAVFRKSDDRLYALHDRCPNDNGPLSQGIVHDGFVTCPICNWVISLETGAAQGADHGQTATFPVRLDGETIHLGV